MKTKNTLSILLISLFVVLNVNAQSVDVDNLPTIKVVGTAEIQVVLDIAIKFLLN